MKNSVLPIPTLHRHCGPLGNFSLEKRIPPKNVQGEKNNNQCNSHVRVYSMAGTIVTENSKCRK